jgi:MerR family copper efflux transcriptional regulator
MDSMGIGAFAKCAGVAVDTVRYYERNGLLRPRSRLASGYRRYGALELARLRFIRRAKALGFSLKEVRELLALSRGSNVGRIKQTAQRKLQDVERRIASLQSIRNGLTVLIAECPGRGAPLDCPILKALGAEQLYE